MMLSQSKKNANSCLQKYKKRQTKLQQAISALTLIPSIVKINMVEYKLLNRQDAFTVGVLSCSAMVIFDPAVDDYLFFHINDVKFIQNGVTTKFESWLDEGLKLLYDKHQQLNLRAIVIGGNKKIFDAVLKILDSKNIELSASYFDNFGFNDLDSTLNCKALYFSCSQKKAFVYGLALPKLELQLTNKHYSLGDFPNYYTELRYLSLILLKEEWGDDDKTLMIPEKDSIQDQGQKHKRRLSF